jgi:hypothetical protein
MSLVNQMKHRPVLLYKGSNDSKEGNHERRDGAGELIQRLQRGDLEALGELFKAHKDMVYAQPWRLPAMSARLKIFFKSVLCVCTPIAAR